MFVVGVPIVGVSIVSISIVGVPIVDILIVDSSQRVLPLWKGDSYAELWSDSRQRIEYS